MTSVNENDKNLVIDKIIQDSKSCEKFFKIISDTRDNKINKKVGINND